MAIAGLGNGGVPTTKIEALAGELRFLKSGMADMQGRLDALLVEIGVELQGAQSESEPAAEVTEVVAELANEAAIAEMPAVPDVEISVAVIEAPETCEAGEIEAIVVTEPSVEFVEAAQTETIAPVEVADMAVVPEAVERVQVESAEVTVPAEPTAQEQSVVDAIPTVDGSEPVAPVEVWAEAVVSAGEQVDTPAAELPGQNIVVLAEHRAKAGTSRGVIGRTARWAAAIALIATVAAVAAAGTGFAGNGEQPIKSLCAVAGEGCSITLGMP